MKKLSTLMLSLCLLGLNTLSIAQAGPVVDTTIPTLPIYAIQGAGFLSPHQGQHVLTRGVVTAVGLDGFYLQDSQGDGIPETSDGIFVSQKAPSVRVGDFVGVMGMVDEEPVQDKSIGLTRTQLLADEIILYRIQQPFPKATLLGENGRTIPKARISSYQGNVNQKVRLNVLDGLDFFESLEGMLVEIETPRLTAAGSAYGDIFVIADAGKAAFPSLNQRFSLLLFLEAQDYNPELLNLKNPHNPDVKMTGLPGFNASDYHKGDLFQSSLTGILDFNTSSRPGYFVGGYFIYPTMPLPKVQRANLLPETSLLKAGPRQLTVANYNVENFTRQNPEHNPDKAQGIARHIVQNLNSPDILMLQEVADNDGYAQASMVIAADQTLRFLAQEIRAAGGPIYDFVEIAPENGQDGGRPNANIRVAYLYQPDRVQWVSKPVGDANTAIEVDEQGALSLNPGRIEPQNPAFKNGRKTLVAEFVFQGQHLILVNNHLKSKRGDGSLWSADQPPVFHSEIQRKEQAQIISAFVQAVLSRKPHAHVILAGDFNDFYASETLRLLKGNVLKNLIEELPFNERYTYVYKGSSQTLDQMVISPELFQRWQPEVDVVHLNAEFSEHDIAESDHDPILARFTLPE